MSTKPVRTLCAFACRIDPVSRLCPTAEAPPSTRSSLVQTQRRSAPPSTHGDNGWRADLTSPSTHGDNGCNANRAPPSTHGDNGCNANRAPPSTHGDNGWPVDLSATVK